MSRWKKKKRKWLLQHARALNQKKQRRSQTVYGNSPGSSTQRFYSRDERPVVIQTPPRNFSLINNPEETMSFFADFAKEINRNQSKTHFIVDSRNVESVTVDSLIYLIAILQNEKQNRHMKYMFSGNFPENDAARRVYTESGFTDYVDSRMKVLPESTNTMRIICGINNNPQSAKDLSSFVIESLGKTKKDILPLQKVLIELMSNVYHHAYEKNSFMAKKWYMYAEHIDDYVRCVFVDTGLGIAKTARKNWGEKLRLLFGLQVDDVKIIQSIFKNEFRTSTNESYRGNGLVSVRENIKADIFEVFQVLSGRGRCVFPKDPDPNEMLTYCYSNKLYGTLYEFIIR